MTPISFTIDIIVVLVSCGVLLYCQLLSRRLRALHSLKSGVGEAIVNLSAAIKQSSDANEKIAIEARDALIEVDEAIGRIQQQRQMAEDVLENLDGQINRARRTLAGPIESAGNLSSKLESLNDRARIEIEALTKAVSITNKVSMLVSSRRRKVSEQSGKATDSGDQNVHQLSETSTAARVDNPFQDPKAEVKS